MRWPLDPCPPVCQSLRHRARRRRTAFSANYLCDDHHLPPRHPLLRIAPRRRLPGSPSVVKAEEEDENHITAHESLFGAVRTIALADTGHGPRQCRRHRPYPGQGPCFACSAILSPDYNSLRRGRRPRWFCPTLISTVPRNHLVRRRASRLRISGEMIASDPYCALRRISGEMIASGLIVSLVHGERGARHHEGLHYAAALLAPWSSSAAGYISLRRNAPAKIGTCKEPDFDADGDIEKDAVRMKEVVPLLKSKPRGGKSSGGGVAGPFKEFDLICRPVVSPSNLHPQRQPAKVQ